MQRVERESTSNMGQRVARGWRWQQPASWSSWKSGSVQQWQARKQEQGTEQHTWRTMPFMSMTLDTSHALRSDVKLLAP